ncbi:MAG: Ig-like domain-containing protein [Bacteroidales bacterium]|nr:Ig-like domain-containing protein [Bacteroidales bacterium]
MSRSYRYFALLILVVCWSASGFPASVVQESKISPYMLFSYLKNSDSQQVLQVKMTNITQTGEVPLPGLTIRFLNGENLLGEATTDVTGSASYTIGSTVALYVAEDGTWPFTATFDGDTLVDATFSDLSITDVNLEMTLGEEEGKRSITLTATMPADDGVIPVAGDEVGVYVPRMFSLLPVATGVLDETGTVQLEFPNDIPGDSLGNITVIGRFNEHYLYGNVEKRENREWGTPVIKAPPVYRSLWSTLAPKWMVVTLAILLLGVWSQYMLVIINLIRIRMDGLKNEKK